MAAEGDYDPSEFDIGLDTLDITTEVINFDEIDEDLERFQEDEMVQQALHRGVDLKKYGRELEKELREAEAASIAQYMDNKQQVLDLHSQIHDCDDVLLRMQDMLLGFQGDLSGISEEIRYLQEESFSMNIRLKNRRIAEELLHHFLENASISPEVMSCIAQNTIDEEFLEAVVDLSNKLNFIQREEPAKDGSSLDIAPIETKISIVLLPELDKLKALAISKIRDYFSLHFMALRKPKTNVQILQQSSLIKYAPLYRFLQQEAEATADDLRIIYVESMGKTVFHLFKNYYNQLLKLDASNATKADTIALEETTLKSVFTATVSKGATNPSKKSDIFTLGDRVQVVELAESAPAILVHVANAEAQSFPCEVIWRSVIKHLIDAVTNEFLFIVDFFKTDVMNTFHAIFDKTINHLVQAMETYVGSCYDMLGLLLIIKVAHAQRLVMQRRRIPVVDPFFDRISMLLWPKFKSVFDVNIKAFKEINVKKLGSVTDLAPHYICKRYGEFVASIVTLQGSTGVGSGAGVSGGGDRDEDIDMPSDSLGIGGGGELMLQHDLVQLRMEMIGLLEKLAGTVSSNRDRKVFFINNLDCMLNIFAERRVQSEEVHKFDELLLRQREMYVEEELICSFPKLIPFILETERDVLGDNQPRGTGAAARGNLVDEKTVETLVMEFHTSWRKNIEQINANVLQYFGNIRNGMEILKQVLTQLLLYYSRFQDIIKKSFARPPEFTKHIVGTPTILMEIKRYSRAF